MQSVQEQGITACGVDHLLVVCTFDHAAQSGCLHETGPCQHGLTKGGYTGECQGRSQYTAHLAPEKEVRISPRYHEARAALSIAVEALCTMTYNWYDDRDRREELFQTTRKKIRGVAGDIRLTTMKVVCAWCDTAQGEKEGDGSVGETSTICPSCLQKQLEKLPSEARRVALAIGKALNPEAVKVTGETPEEFRQSLGSALLRPETRETAKVAALTVSE